MTARRSSVWLFSGLGLVAVVVALSLTRREDPATIASRDGAGASDEEQARNPASAHALASGPSTSPPEAARRAVDAAPAGAELAPPSDPPILIAGTVHDELGAPLAGVELELELYSDGPTRVERAVSDADGRYTVRGEPMPRAQARFSRDGIQIVSALGPLPVLRAHKPGYAATREDSADFDFEAEAHAIVLQRGGSLRGRLLFDDFLARERFEIRLAAGSDGWESPLAADGTFEFNELPAGFAVLGVIYDERSIEWLYSLSVPVGAACVDERLDPIDLRGALRAWSVQLLRPDDTPLASTAISFEWSARDGALTGVWSERTDLEGRCASVLPTAIARAWLDVGGFQDTWLDVETTTVKLRAMPHVRFGVDPRASAFFSRLRLQFDFVDRTTPTSLAARRASIGADGEAEMTFDVAGRYQLSWVPLELGSTALYWPEHVIDVRPEPAEQYFDLALSDAQLAALGAALGR